MQIEISAEIAVSFPESSLCFGTFGSVVASNLVGYVCNSWAHQNLGIQIFLGRFAQLVKVSWGDL